MIQRKMLEESGKMVKDLAGKLGASVQDLRQLVVGPFHHYQDVDMADNLHRIGSSRARRIDCEERGSCQGRGGS